MNTISPRFNALPRIAPGVVLLLLAAGCSSKGSVTGKVFYKDKPLPGGTVQLIHPKLGSVSSTIAADGSYQFVDIPPAEVKIAVTGSVKVEGKPLPPNADWEKIKSGPDWEKMKGKPGFSEEELKQKMRYRPTPPPGAASVPLPKKYGDPLESGLTYTVTSGSQIHDIKLD